ncbi:unnamed protein product, partial [Pylaiella littoralis]
MVDVFSKQCTQRGCTTRPNYGVMGTKTAEFCSGHAKDGMVDVFSKQRTHHGCTKQPRYGVMGTKTAEFCSGDAKAGMVDVFSKQCTHHGCTKQPRYGVMGTKTAEFCSGHAKDGMVHVFSKRCAQPGCTTIPSFGVTGGIRTSCARHAEDGMVHPVTSSTSSASVVDGSSSGSRGCSSVAVDGRTPRRAGPGEKNKGHSPPSSQTGTSAGRSKADSKRTRQTLAHTPVTPNLLETAADEGHTPVEDGLMSELNNAVVKTELAVSFKSDLPGSRSFPGGSEAGNYDIPTEEAWSAEPDGAVKAEVGIFF